MRVLTPIPSAPPVIFVRPLDFCLMMEACAAVGLAYPSTGDVRWFQQVYGDLLPGPNVDTNCFNPYQITNSGVVMKPWASAAYRYMGRYVRSKAPPEKLQPEEWRENLANLLADLVFVDEDARATLEVMHEWWLDPQDPAILAARDAYDHRVRQALDTNSLIAKPKAAKAAIDRFMAGDSR